MEKQSLTQIDVFYPERCMPVFDMTTVSLISSTTLPKSFKLLVSS